MARARIDRSQLPPGPRLPRMLQLIGTWTRPAPSLERLRARYGKRVSVQLPFQPPFVVLSDPDDIRELFTAPAELLHPGEGARVLEPMLGRHSLILLDEAEHMEQRKLLLPAFHGERMQRTTGLMEELTARELDRWPLGEPIELHSRLQRLTLEIILRTVFGLEQGEALDQLTGALTRVLGYSESPISILPVVQRRLSWFGPVRRLRLLLEETDRLIFALIEQRRAEGDAGRDDVLAMLLGARHEDDSPMSDQELRDELMTALVAGHETTASQLAWAFERMARDSRVWRALQAETDAGAETSYLNATITEILRLRPVLPNAEPRLTKAPVRIGPFTYPAGVALLASAHLVHRDPEIYPQPHAFRPERFLDSPPGTYTWIPFGGGRRRCIGAAFATQEMRIVLRQAAARFDLAPGGPRSERARRRSITFSPEHGSRVILAERTRPAAVMPGELAGVAT